MNYDSELWISRLKLLRELYGDGRLFSANDFDKHNKEKENAWILALNKRNALAKRLDAIQREHEKLEIEYGYKRFLQETGRE